MRGPGIKLDLDVRRLWTCPVCGKQRRLSGHITSPVCACREGGVIMTLTADSKLLRRAERLTPLPFVKHPGVAKPVIPEPAPPVEESPPPIVAVDSEPEMQPESPPPSPPADDDFATGL